MSNNNSRIELIKAKVLLTTSERTYKMILGLLSNLKQTGFRYKLFHKHINILLSSLEEIIKYYMFNIQSKNEQLLVENESHSSQIMYNYHESIFSFIFLYFQEETTTNSLTDIFLNFIFTYLEEILSLEEYFFDNHKSLIIKIIETIINKKIDFTNYNNDSKNLFTNTKILFIFLKISQNNIDINNKAIIEYLFKSIQILFSLTKHLLVDEYIELGINIVKILFKGDMTNWNECVDILLEKILFISEKKDSLIVEHDSSSQSFYFSMLLFCLQSLLIISSTGYFNLNFQGHATGLTKIFVHLSFWDNSSIISYSCQIIEEIWIGLINYKSNNPSYVFENKYDFNIIINYFYNKRLKEYHEIISQYTTIDKLDNDHEGKVDIKLSVLELVVNYLGNLIVKGNLLIIFYSSTDITHISSGVIFDIIGTLFKFYSLNLPYFNYLKSLIGNIVNFITELLLKNSEDMNNSIMLKEYISNQSNSIVIFKSVIEKINEGKYKKLFALLQETFGIINTTQPKKKKVKAIVVEEEPMNIIENVPTSTTVDPNSIPVVKSDSTLTLEPSTTIEDKQSTLNDIISRNRDIARLIAIIIRYSNHVDVNIIYEIIGLNEDFSNLILQEYMKTFNFTGMEILFAYRVFVSTFKLGGESYILENILTQYSKKYFEDNKENSIFQSEDEVSIFSYSILMLNTDLHNPIVKEHMKLEEFIRNNRVTGYFQNVPDAYFKDIYKSIQVDPLKIAKSRTSEYSKSEETFELIRCKRNYYQSNKHLQSDILSIIKNNETELYPLSLINDSLFMIKSINNYDFDSKAIITYNLFDDFLREILNNSSNFYSFNEHNNDSIISNICKIAINQNKPQLIDKILSELTKTLTNNKFSSVIEKFSLYKLFFNIAIDYTDKISTYIEVFFSNIINFIMLNLNIDSRDDIFNSNFSQEYRKNINKIIEHSYSIIYKKKYFKKEGYFGFIFGSSSNEDDYIKGLETFKSHILKSIKLSNSIQTYHHQRNSSHNIQSQSTHSSNNLYSLSMPTTPQRTNADDIVLSHSQSSDNLVINNKENSLNDIQVQVKQEVKESKANKSISFNKILDKIRKNQEEFPFFLNLAFMKIIDNKDISELCLSIIFLEEIINQNLSEQEFSKIWHNLLNILYTKLDLNSSFGEKEHIVFEIILISDFVTSTISKYIQFIESQDYYSFIEKYIEVDNLDLIYYFLENNNKIVSQPNSINIIKKEQIMDSLIYLFDKYVTQASPITPNAISLISIQNNEKNQNIITFLCNLIQAVPSINYFSSESINTFVKILKTLKEKNIVDKPYLVNLIKAIVNKIHNSEISLIDVKWDLFIQLFNFILGAVLNDNTKIQTDYLIILNELMKDIKIPLLKFKEIINIINVFYNTSIYLKQKADYYWEGIFLLFLNIIKSNNDLLSSDNDMENLWNIFIRKYIISYVDSQRLTNSLTSESGSNTMLGLIIEYVKENSK